MNNDVVGIQLMVRDVIHTGCLKKKCEVGSRLLVEALKGLKSKSGKKRYPLLVLHLPDAVYLEGPIVLHVRLDDAVHDLPPDPPLGVEDSVAHLVLGGVSYQSLAVLEGNIARSGPVVLLVGDDLQLAVLEHGHAGVGGAQVNTNCCPPTHLGNL